MPRSELLGIHMRQVSLKLSKDLAIFWLSCEGNHHLEMAQQFVVGFSFNLPRAEPDSLPASHGANHNQIS